MMFQDQEACSVTLKANANANLASQAISVTDAPRITMNSPTKAASRAVATTPGPTGTSHSAIPRLEFVYANKTSRANNVESELLLQLSLCPRQW